MQTVLDIDWQYGEGELRVTVIGRFTAADRRRLEVNYTIDGGRRLISLHCRHHQSGKVYRHQSMLRGFCQIPFSDLQGLDPESCDWQAEVVESGE